MLEGHVTITSREHTKSRGLSRNPRPHFVTEEFEQPHGRSDKNKPSLRTSRCKTRVLAQETIPWVYGITPAIPSSTEELLAIKVSGHSAAFEGNCSVNLAHVQAQRIILGIDAH